MIFLKNYKLIIGFCIVLYAVSMSFLYKGSLSDIKALELANNSLKTELIASEAELLTHKLISGVQKQVISEDCKKRQQVIDNSQKLLDELNALPNEPISPDNPVKVNSNATSTINIDSPLPDSLKRVLNKADNDYKNRTINNK